MKIGIVCYPTFGGSGIVATELGKALALNGHHVHFITYRQPVRLDVFSENIFYHEVTLNNYPLFEFPPYELALAGKIVEVAKYENLDILHVHYAIPHASAALLAQQILNSEGIKIPFVTTLHGTDITIVGQDVSFYPVVKFAINNSNGVTAVSQDLKDETNKVFDIKKEIRVIYNFVDTNKFKVNEGSCKKLSIASCGEKVITHASNFRKVKRVEDVVNVFANILKVIPSKLLMVGDGPERANAEQLCRDLGIYKNVRFLGKQDAVESILSISDLFLMPSEKESFGLAALEAMSCKVPVISSNVGGLPELNKNGFSGYLSNIGDIDDMSKNAIHILSDQKILDEFKENAFIQSQKFSLEKILPSYEDYYNEIIQNYK